jgi:hypothetical protein
MSKKYIPLQDDEEFVQLNGSKKPLSRTGSTNDEITTLSPSKQNAAKYGSPSYQIQMNEACKCQLTKTIKIMCSIWRLWTWNSNRQNLSDV